MVVPQHLQVAEDNVPIVLAAADKGERKGTGVIYIRSLWVRLAY